MADRSRSSSMRCSMVATTDTIVTRSWSIAWLTALGSKDSCSTTVIPLTTPRNGIDSPPT